MKKAQAVHQKVPVLAHLKVLALVHLSHQAHLILLQVLVPTRALAQVLYLHLLVLFIAIDSLVVIGRERWALMAQTIGEQDMTLEDEIKFEWIAANNMGANNWAENANAAIDCNGFDAGAIDADFTVRPAEDSIPITVHYSDGIDTYIMESDETHATT